MMPEFGDSGQPERLADDLLGGPEVDPTEELTAKQFDELCAKIMDVTGGEGDVVQYDKDGLSIEVAYLHSFDEDGRLYLREYHVEESRLDTTRDDGLFYTTKQYEIAFEGDELEPDDAMVKSFYESYDVLTKTRTVLELPIRTPDPEDSMKPSLQRLRDKDALGVVRPFNQEDYDNLMRLLALVQQ